MAQVKRKSEWQVSEQPASVSVEQAMPMYGASPARALQMMLEERTGAQGEETRWSRRRSLSLIVAASCALWMALLATAHGIVALVA